MINKAVPHQKDDIEYFNVPIGRLLAFSILSFGLYEIYWVYKNWESIGNNDKININSVLRSMFAPLFIYSFSKRINLSMKSAGYQPLIEPKLLTFIYFLAITTSIFVDRAFDIVSPSFTIFPILFLQNQINRFYESQGRNPKYQQVTRIQLFFVILGSLIWALYISGLFFLDTQL